MTAGVSRHRRLKIEDLPPIPQTPICRGRLRKCPVSSVCMLIIRCLSIACPLHRLSPFVIFFYFDKRSLLCRNGTRQTSENSQPVETPLSRGYDSGHKKGNEWRFVPGTKIEGSRIPGPQPPLRPVPRNCFWRKQKSAAALPVTTPCLRGTYQIQGNTRAVRFR